jgi:hypothetical protein
MPKLDREGNIIRVKKPDDKKPETAKQPEANLPGAGVKEITSKDLETMVPVAQISQDEVDPLAVPVLYDFILHCATYTQPDIDMVFVCENCPFKATTCVDTMLLPDEGQMEAIAAILMRKPKQEVK